MLLLSRDGLARRSLLLWRVQDSQRPEPSARSSYYRDASPKRYPDSRQQCDLVIPDQWAIEFKLLRPFGDNGAEAEHWSENALHPYPGNVSFIGDSIKLIESGFSERKAIVIFGYEHSPPLIDITVVIDSFEAIAKQVVGIDLGERQSAEFGPLVHPVHQQGKVFGWQVLEPNAPPVWHSGE
jgi:hypothetical protein